MISVLVADDQTLVREGIVILLGLAPDLRVVGEAADGERALELAERLRPDLLLLDLRMPRRDGLGVLRELRARGAELPVLVLTTFDDDHAMLEATRAGARGFLRKDVSFQQLTDAIRAVAAGAHLVHPSLSEPLARALERRPTSFEAIEAPNALSARERRVLALIAAGCTSREIAEALDLSLGTVKNYTSTILSKLGVRDRTRAVLRGYELGLL